MWTSKLSKPARSKAAAISVWLLTPCSRRIAMRGRAPRAMYGAATSSAGSKRSATCSPGSSLPSMRSNSSMTQSGSSRSDAMRALVSLQMRCSVARERRYTRRPSRQMSIVSCACGLPITCDIVDNPCSRSTPSTASRASARTCSTAPGSSQNSACSVRSLRCTATCSGRIL